MEYDQLLVSDRYLSISSLSMSLNSPLALKKSRVSSKDMFSLFMIIQNGSATVSIDSAVCDSSCPRIPVGMQGYLSVLHRDGFAGQTTVEYVQCCVDISVYGQTAAWAYVHTDRQVLVHVFSAF